MFSKSFLACGSALVYSVYEEYRGNEYCISTCPVAVWVQGQTSYAGVLPGSRQFEASFALSHSCYMGVRCMPHSRYMHAPQWYLCVTQFSSVLHSCYMHVTHLSNVCHDGWRLSNMFLLPCSYNHVSTTMLLLPCSYYHACKVGICCITSSIAFASSSSTSSSSSRISASRNACCATCYTHLLAMILLDHLQCCNDWGCHWACCILCIATLIQDLRTFSLIQDHSTIYCCSERILWL